MKPKKLCSAAGCYERVPLGTTYCKRHEKAVEAYKKRLKDKGARLHQTAKERHQANKKRYQKRMYGSKESKAQQFYRSTAWKKLSRRMMEKNPVCVECLKQGIIKKADVIDHIVPIRQDWSRRLDESNLQSLCYRHHNQKTKAEKAARECKKIHYF